jgi:hypothetical protein
MGSPDQMEVIQAEKTVSSYHSGSGEQRIEKSLAAAENRTETNSSSESWWDIVSFLQAILNRKRQARASFEKSLALPDTHMAHHLAREVLPELDANM